MLIQIFWNNFIRHYLFCFFANFEASFKRVKTKKPLELLSKGFLLVGMTGFEPAAPKPPAWYATGLRHIPFNYEHRLSYRIAKLVKNCFIQIGQVESFCLF